MVDAVNAPARVCPLPPLSVRTTVTPAQRKSTKYGPAFSRVVKASGIAELRTAYRAPRQNATCERFLGSVRRECLDHLLIVSEGHLRRVLREYVSYFNHHRPHQALRQQVPDTPAGGTRPVEECNRVFAIPVLGGLHHVYQRAA